MALNELDTLGELLRRTGLDMSTLTTVLNTVARNPILQGIELDVVILTGAEQGRARHGLPRLPRGAVVIGVSDSNQIPAVELPSGDGKFITVDINSPAPTDITVRTYVW